MTVDLIIDILALFGFGYVIIKQIIFIGADHGGSKYLLIAFAIKNVCLLAIVVENIMKYPESLIERIALLICSLIWTLTYTGSTFAFLDLKDTFHKAKHILHR